MLRKILFAVFGLFLSASAHAGQAINVEWVHKFIKQEHNLDIPYGPNLISPKQVVNMDYVLKVVDIANAMLNGDGWTNYGESEYATREVADTVAGIYCIRNLIEHYYFTATTTPDKTSFSFKIGANGVYHIDWGDGTREHYDKPNTKSIVYSHTYDTAGEYHIKIGGYSRGYLDVVVQFTGNKQLAGISGSLGKVFSTLKNPITGRPMQPGFWSAFGACSNLGGTIPPDLFTGVHGQAGSSMFGSLFADCSNLEGSIPRNLFRVSGVNVYLFYCTFKGCKKLSGEIPWDLFAKNVGQPMAYMFNGTFSGCSGLSGELDERLFENITGQPEIYAFASTFLGCTKLSGIIPAKLFSRVSGEPRQHMFDGTFSGCTSLSGLESGLFSGIKGKPAVSMFYDTFNGCVGLVGEIPAQFFGNFENGEPQMYMFARTFYNCVGLTKISDDLFGTIRGQPAMNMFSQTFYNCTGLQGNIPPNLFGKIQGTPAGYMFSNTFYNCNGLTGSIPDMLFGDLYGQPQASMFDRTFQGCAGLTGAIPADLFGGVENADGSVLGGTPADSMFAGTFSGCVKLGSEIADIDKPDYMQRGYAIPETLFGRIAENSDAAAHMFAEVFYNCVELSGNLPPLLFGGGYGLTDGTASRMFFATFYCCAKLTGAIPDGFFGDMTGTTYQDMFRNTFSGCVNLGSDVTDENMPQYMRDGYAIPPYLFGHITGPAIVYAYAHTFNNCSNLTGALPDYLFAGIYGSGASMFDSTFRNCAKLTALPEHLFGAITSANSFVQTFQGCTGLKGFSTKVYVESENTYKYLYDVWPTLSYCVYCGCKGLSDYDTMPSGYSGRW